uniref:Uncharacterized protein n=1 Tax=viral metagenome TaxID=1070528 RepID=A0A6M3LD99_9ZZZZ
MRIKVSVVCCVLLLFVFAATANATPRRLIFHLNTLANEVSAVTSCTYGGVSAMVVEDATRSGYRRADGAFMVPIGDIESGRCFAKLSGVSRSNQAAASGGVWSGSSFFAYVVTANNVADLTIADRQPIYFGTALSGDTITPVPVELTAGRLVGMLFSPGAGVSLYSGATIELDIGLPEEGWQDPLPIHTGTSIYTMNAANGAVSVTIPYGTRYIEINSEYSGASIYYTRAVAISAADPAILPGEVKGFAGSRAELQRIKIGAPGVAGYAVVNCYTKEF